MSAENDHRDDVPTNVQLAERTARIEENLEHVGDTVDRIESRLDEQHEELVDDVEGNQDKIDQMWPAYRVGKYLIPLGIAVGGTLGALSSAGLV